MTVRQIQKVCWWTINIILVWTAVLVKITVLSNIAVLCLICISWKFSSPEQRRSILGFCLFILFLSAFSLVLENKINLIFRFSIVVLFIGLSYFIKIPKDIIFKAISVPALAYSMLLIIGEFFCLFFLDDEARSALRQFVLNNEIGDIYPKYGNFVAIQLVGSAALPFAFMLSLGFNIFKRFPNLKRLLLLSGVVIAGNFAYLVAIFVYICFNYFISKYSLKKWFFRFATFSILFLALMPFIVNFVTKTLEEKKDESNAIRIEQATVLLTDLSDNGLSFIMGRGLGNTVEIVGKFRDYRGAVYYELQSLYILNQLGVLPFLFFILWNLVLTLKYIPLPRCQMIYLCYVIYAVTNPYIFNTNQIVVIITLVNLSRSHSYKTPDRIENLNNFQRKALS